jgi:ABC-type phosphate/phosphonate transport system permease subunit
MGIVYTVELTPESRAKFQADQALKADRLILAARLWFWVLGIVAWCSGTIALLFYVLGVLPRLIPALIENADAEDAEDSLA